MQRHNQLLLDNKAWAREQTDQDPMFFERMAETQTPDFLWIGCSDSRVSPTEITQTRPGEIFIHRNVANLVVHTDFNLLSVLQYAVEVLQIKHVIVCGHYGCGGVKAALTHKSYGAIDRWLTHIKDVHRLHQAEIDALPEERQADRLAELNVREQLFNLAKTALIQRCWQRYQRPYLHGWIYGLKDGLIKQLLEMPPGSDFGLPMYRYEELDH